MNNMPRPEYPRPQLTRPEWMNLNGTWDFEFDFGKSGRERRMYQEGTFTRKILVPFCPESDLSGIGYKDYMPAVWYNREITIPEAYLKGKLLLHFGAVDYASTIYVNGQQVGTHEGGYDSFTLDITAAAHPGENVLTLYAEDNTLSGLQPKGKQSSTYYSRGCDYTRTTGIWQTVWLEPVPETYIADLHLTPDVPNERLLIEATVNGPCDGETLTAAASFEGKFVCEASAIITETMAAGKPVSKVLLQLPVPEPKLWDLGQGALYDLTVSVGADSVNSYFGMRSVQLKNNALYLNGRPVFQRLVLDQGFYPDGIYTAPSDEALIHDIELSMAAGFNGARLHQKVFEARFLYHADQMGYLVWGEHANWGLDITTAQGLEQFLPEWISIVNRDYSHPALIGWCPFNETWDKDGTKQDPKVLAQIYQVTKQMDPYRPVIDTSGNFHVITDIYDVHDYEQSPEVLAEHYAPMASDINKAHETFPERQHYSGQPYFVSEFGGTWWSADVGGNNWGYGKQPKSEEEAVSRICGLAHVLLSNPNICAFCYTQLTDVEQEQNGIYTYGRAHKYSDAGYQQIREAFTEKAAIEK